MIQNSDQSPELQTLAAEVGQFIHYWGFKKIHGRIWTHVFLANTPPDAATLMKQLNVSKALISLTLNDLLEFDVIREAGKSAKGTMTYIANPAVIDIIMDILRNREKKLLSEIQKAQNRLQEMNSDSLQSIDINVERLIILGTMVNLAQNALDAIIGMGSLDLSSWNSLNQDLVNENSK
jgi:DNA-binding transcriptional regulator GbsR (MarR family)